MRTVKGRQCIKTQLEDRMMAPNKGFLQKIKHILAITGEDNPVMIAPVCI